VINVGGRTAVVTGAGRGIGAAIAAALADAGANVAVWDVDSDQAAKTAATLARPSLGLGVDVTKASEVRAALIETVSTLGPVDVFVNNAGVDVIRPFLDTDVDDWERILSVNLMGLFNCCKAVLPAMVERGRGTIINLGSEAGRVGSSGEAVYSATKGGVIAFTKTIAREHAKHGVTVNCVCPGPTDTALLDQVAESSQKLYDSLARAIPMRRIGQPADIAGVVVFLASDAASYMTGQTLSVSGGLTMV
jgi:2-hydroxycyclohexanecarboxyl-CoA dehydrogenase